MTDFQHRVLIKVVAARPHAVPSEIAKALSKSPAVVQHSLDALTRRSFVTPVEQFGKTTVYVATPKGKLKLAEIAMEKAA